MAIEINQTVKMKFQVRIDGEIVDGTSGNKPFEFVFGTGQVIAGLEKRMKNMKLGDQERFLVPAADAYGEYNKDAIQVMPIEEFAAIEELKVGMQLQGEDENDQPIQVIVKEISDTEIVIDYNHPLAGKDLEYIIQIESLI
jgi:FKBP-type peptidyl-prolyl cis-trans isomerase SlyD